MQADVEELLAVRRPDPQAWACDVLVVNIAVFDKKFRDQLLQRVEICSSAGFVVWSDPRHASVRHTQQLRRILINCHPHHYFDAGRGVLDMQDFVIRKIIRRKTNQPLQGLDAAEERGSAALEFIEHRCRIEDHDVIVVSAGEYLGNVEGYVGKKARFYQGEGLQQPVLNIFR